MLNVRQLKRETITYLINSSWLENKYAIALISVHFMS